VTPTQQETMVFSVTRPRDWHKKSPVCLNKTGLFSIKTVFDFYLFSSNQIYSDKSWFAIRDVNFVHPTTT